MLVVEDLGKTFDRVPAVTGVSFSVRPGEVLGYLGPNGSGKSTTVRMIAGLLKPSSGRVTFDGVDLATDPLAFKRRLGYVPEEAWLHSYLSGEEYLQLTGRLRALDERRLAVRIDALLELFGLGARRAWPIATYSKGMKQKVLIAAALLGDPDLLVFDEPLSGLDVTSALVFRELLGQFARAGKAVLYSSHVLEAVERACSRVVILYGGRVVAQDEVSRLRELLGSPSLEDVFTKLVVPGDPTRTASEIVAAMRA